MVFFPDKFSKWYVQNNDIYIHSDRFGNQFCKGVGWQSYLFQSTSYAKTQTQTNTHTNTNRPQSFQYMYSHWLRNENGMQIDLTKSSEGEDQSCGTKSFMSGDVHAC